MSDIRKLIDKAQDYATTIIDLPLQNGDYRRLEAILKKTEPPAFSLLFKANALSLTGVDRERPCRLSIKNPDKPITLLADISDLDAEVQTMTLVGKEPLRPEVLREYFRVSLRAPIIARFEAAPGLLGNRSWEIHGETVDMSGGGVLANFPANPPSDYHIRLEIKLPCDREPLVAFATVVRTVQLRKKLCQVAFHFDTIEPKIRDLIISNCLQEQRRQLRERVRTE